MLAINIFIGGIYPKDSLDGKQRFRIPHKSLRIVLLKYVP